MNGSNCSCMHDEGCWVVTELQTERDNIVKLRKSVGELLALEMGDIEKIEDPRKPVDEICKEARQIYDATEKS